MKNIPAKFSLIVLFITFSIQVSAQYFHVKKVEDENELSFLVLTGKTPAENLINTYLQGQELNLLPGKQKQSYFENVAPAKGSTTGITELNYQVLTNSSSVFSVEINREYTSGKLNESSTVYNFDARTGRLIQLSDLFTTEGYQAVRKFVIADRKKRLSNYLKTAKNPADADATKVYTECLNSMTRDNLNADDLKFGANGLSLTRKSCSDSHYFQALEDEANVYANQLSIKFLLPHLNDYGKCLLKIKSEKCLFSPLAALRKGVYKGKINQMYPITLLITYLEDKSCYGTYFYDKYGKAIDFSGTIEKDSRLMLKKTQSDDPKSKPEVFNLKIMADGSLTGTWGDGEYTFPIHLVTF